MRLLQFTSGINIVQTQFIASQQNGEAIQTQKRAKHIQTPQALKRRQPQKQRSEKRAKHTETGVAHSNAAGIQTPQAFKQRSIETCEAH